jgi:hypothetical protein
LARTGRGRGRSDKHVTRDVDGQTQPSPNKTPTVRELEDSDLPTPEITAAAQERRKRFRFQMNAELRYQFGESDPIKGTGKVENISSKALAFRADRLLVPGVRLKVSMAWPAKLDECKLRLAFEGFVRRVRGGLVVVTIERPEFRTSGKSTPVGCAEVTTVAGGIEALLASMGVFPGAVETAD